MEGIGAKLKLLREASGLSQAEVARRVDISKCYYWELEKAEKKAVSGDILYRIAKLHDVSVEWFFENQACARCGSDDPLRHVGYHAPHWFLNYTYLCQRCFDSADELELKQGKEWKAWERSD